MSIVVLLFLYSPAAAAAASLQLQSFLTVLHHTRDLYTDSMILFEMSFSSIEIEYASTLFSTITSLVDA